LREEILTILDDHLSRLSIVPRVIFGEPFDFMQSRIVEVPTGVLAGNLAEFRAALATVSVNAIYFHTIEAPRRLGRPETDFAAWLREGLGLDALATAINRVDPHTGSLERFRNELLRLCDTLLAQGIA
jgi:hypothetical protein